MIVRFFTTCFLLALVTALGCQTETTTTTSDDDHSHGDDHVHASSLEEGVGQLQALKDEIEKAFTTGEPTDADAALHSLGHLIDDDIVGLVNKSDRSEEDKKAVKDAADVLMVKYGELHEAVHGKASGEVDSTVYESVSKDIDAAMESLHRLAGHEDHDEGSDHKEESDAQPADDAAAGEATETEEGSTATE